MPVPAGGFVRRVAHTPHYDGVRKGGKEPAVIGIFGQAPIEFKLTDPTKPPVREVQGAVLGFGHPQRERNSSLSSTDARFQKS